MGSKNFSLIERPDFSLGRSVGHQKITGRVDANNLLSLRYLCFQSKQHTGPRARKLRFVSFAPNKSLVHAVNAICFFMETIVAEFTAHVQVHEQCAGHSCGQTQDVDEGEEFLSLNVASK